MLGNLYSVVGFTNVLVCILIACCNRIINDKDEYKSKRFVRMLVVFGLFSLSDGIWGLIDTHTLNYDYRVYTFFINVFFFMATHASYTWFVVMSEQFEFKSNSKLRYVEMLPALAGLVIMTAQFFNGCVFTVDPDFTYHIGPFREVLFIIQFFYFVYAMLKALYVMNFKNYYDWKHIATIMVFLIIPLFAGILQYKYPMAPYYSIGFLLAEIAVFDGTIVIEKQKQRMDDTIHYQKVSSEIYGALSALANGFVSVHLFDLKLNKQQVVKSTPHVDQFINEEDDAHTQIIKVMEGVTSSEYTDSTVAFVDTYTLSERMKGKKYLNHEFIGKNQGWCVSSFIKVEEDADGNLTKVIHAVQSIDEFKKKEIAYTEALTRAYKDKNAIYAELLKMQAVGVIATDENENIILANDMAMNMFGHEGKDPVGMPFSEFWKNAVMETPEKSTEDYTNALINGGKFTYEMKITNPEKQEEAKYVLATANMIELLDGSEVMITCYSDITENKRFEEKLKVLSETDALTGINNRGSGEAKTIELLENNEEGLFCLIDIDKFKSINDTYGHQTGDKVLVKFAETLQNAFRNEDIIMRLGGDEFAIFAKSVVTKAMAQIKINRLFESIADIRIPDMPDEIISASLGAVIVRKHGERVTDDFTSIYSKADSVMYKSKEIDGCCMTFYKEKD